VITLSRQTNLRARATAKVSTGKGKVVDRAGSVTVSYRDAHGTRHDAIVLGPGSVSGLKLRLPSFGGTNKDIDNVALATGEYQANVYFTA
jgi:hypothetical protein